jgi:hypothetical protein
MANLVVILARGIQSRYSITLCNHQYDIDDLANSSDTYYNSNICTKVILVTEYSEGALRVPENLPSIMTVTAGGGARVALPTIIGAHAIRKVKAGTVS